jgi:tetratricopeptide (TPR) repeat protein
MKEKPESTVRKTPSLLGFALDLLLTGHGWTAKELAEAAVVSEKTVSAYIWEDKLTRERLDELASMMGLGPEDARCAILAARMARSPASPGGSPVDPSPEDRRTHRLAAAMAAGEVFDLVLDELLRDARTGNRRRALEEGRRAADRLKAYSRADQLVLVTKAPEYRHWSVACVLCADSEAAAPQRPSRALELAELALLVAGSIQDGQDGQSVGNGLKLRLQGWCHGFAGNALRALGSDLPAAERLFSEAWRLWDLGKDPAGLLPKAHLLDMEASLRRAQGRFSQALKLHDRAVAAALPDEAGSILANKAATLQQANRHEEALDALALAAKRVDAERQPRLRFRILVNTASTLICLGPGRVQEIKSVAEDLLGFLKAQQVDQDAIAAAILFREAAEEERVTQELVKQLKASVSRARPLP